MLFLSIYLWIAISFVVGVKARRLGRSGGGWVFKSLILSPVVGGLWLLALGRKIEGE